MKARTISAYADAKTAQIVERIASLEDRSPAQIAAAALRFYVSLPTEAHAAFRRVEKLGSAQDMDGLARDITRKALDAEWAVAQRQFVDEMAVPADAATEEDILAEAVRLTK